MLCLSVKLCDFVVFIEVKLAVLAELIVQVSSSKSKNRYAVDCMLVV
jgi:hypothetical protein